MQFYKENWHFATYTSSFRVGRATYMAFRITPASDILKVGRWYTMLLPCSEECSFYANIIILIYHKIVNYFKNSLKQLK